MKKDKDSGENILLLIVIMLGVAYVISCYSDHTHFERIPLVDTIFNKWRRIL